MRGAPATRASGRAQGEAPQNIGPQQDQQARRHRGRRAGRQVRQDRGAAEGPHRTGKPQPDHQAGVGVAQPPVGGTRGQGRADLSQVHRGRGQCRAQSGQKQQGGRGHAVPHPEGAVDQLSGQADEGEKNKLAHQRLQDVRSACAEWTHAAGLAGRVSSTTRSAQYGLRVTTSPMTMTAGAVTPYRAATSARHRSSVVVTRWSGW